MRILSGYSRAYPHAWTTRTSPIDMEPAWLTCNRCGSIVALPELHDEWHAETGSE